MRKLIMLVVFTVMAVLAGCHNKNDEKIIINGEVVSDSEATSFVYFGKTNKENDENKENEVKEDIRANENTVDNEDANKPSLIVYVCGEVKNAGVYELYEKSRVIDAIEAAGGISEAAAVQTLNLAAYVNDGEKIYVPSVDEALNSTVYTDANSMTGSSAGGVSATKNVNINTADRATLMTLPGVGESKADKIIAYREAHGGFSKPEDLMLVSGIKEGMYNKVKDYICVN